MNLKNVLDYTNSVYNFGEKINSVERNNIDADTKPSTCIKMFIGGVLSGRDSINSIVTNSQDNKMRSIFKSKEFIPQTTAFRDCFNDIKYSNVKLMHDDMVDTMIKNKVFDNHTYRNTRVAIIDGVESFETHKNIEGLHTRNHKDGNTGYYYKSLGIQWLGDNTNIMIDMVPFEKYEVEDDNEHNNRIKSEGEITVLKRALPILEKLNVEVGVLDCMFMNVPCLNAMKDNGINAIVKLTDTRRLIYKDAKGLFDNSPCQKQYEIVEISERRKIKYPKQSKKKNTDKTDTYTIVREISDAPVGESKSTKRQVEHPKYDITEIRTEKVLKKVKVWSDIFELDGYNYDNGKVRVVKTIETVREKGKVVDKGMYLVTTLLTENLEFIVDVMHKRWTIELNGFRTLKTRYHLKHLFIGSNNAIRIITYLLLIIYNIMELYFNVHTKKYKKINYKNMIENDYKLEIEQNEKLYVYLGS